MKRIEARQLITDTISANGGAMSYDDLRVAVGGDAAKRWHGMKADGQLFPFWVVNGHNTGAVLHVASEPRENVYHEVAVENPLASAPAAPVTE